MIAIMILSIINIQNLNLRKAIEKSSFRILMIMLNYNLDKMKMIWLRIYPRNISKNNLHIYYLV